MLWRERECLPTTAWQTLRQLRMHAIKSHFSPIIALMRYMGMRGGAENMLSENDPACSNQRVAICVCTYKRPKMLGNCLESLAAQLVPAEIRPLTVVIDNEAEPNNEAAVLEFEKSSPYEVAYWHEPRRGIAIARNAALKVVIDSGADWIAFIDDDEKSRS
jgi:hypothetical protein